MMNEAVPKFFPRCARMSTACCVAILMLCSRGAGADLLSRFELVPGAGDAGSFQRHGIAVRHGRRLQAMVLVAPTSVRAPLAGLAGEITLECLATPVFNIGDGIALAVVLRTGAGERLVYSRYFDAARRAEDRDWVPLSIPLELPETSPSELIITVSGGPQGDLVADWLALASISVRQRTQSP